MPEGFDLFAKDWGPESLLGLLLVSIILGLLTPKRTVDKQLAIMKERVAEALEREQYHRSAAEKLQEAVVLQSRQLDRLTEQGEVTIALLNGIQRTANSSPYASSETGRHRGG